MHNTTDIYTADLFLGFLPIKDQAERRDSYAVDYAKYSSPTKRNTPKFQVSCRVQSKDEFDEIWAHFYRTPFLVHEISTAYGEFAVIELDCDRNRQSMLASDIAIALKSEEFDAVLASSGTSLKAWIAFHEIIKAKLLPMDEATTDA